MTWTLGVIGCGKMSHAFLQGICRSVGQDLESICIYDPDESRLRLFEADFKAVTVSKADLIARSDLIILGVKPNQVREALEDTLVYWHEDKILLSIAAGVRSSYLEQLFSDRVPRVIRAMPNTPCLVGEGMVALCAGRSANAADLVRVESLFLASGKAIIVKEQDMDAVTAVSGSGPAYVFLVVEAMIDAAVNVGLSSEVARELVLQTVKGSVLMLEASGEHPALLKQQVSSPGGTTIAGLRELEAHGIRQAFFDAVEAARNRSIELG
jgi:pyrroline-5-carboxylate reductase